MRTISPLEKVLIDTLVDARREILSKDPDYRATGPRQLRIVYLRGYKDGALTCSLDDIPPQLGLSRLFGPLVVYAFALALLSVRFETSIIGPSTYIRDLVQLPIFLIIFYLFGLESSALRDLWLKFLFGKTMTTLRDPIVSKEDPVAMDRSRA